MAETVGLVASIIAILELTKKTVEFLRDAKDGGGDRGKLLSELVNLKGLLELLNKEFQDPRHSKSEWIQWLLGPDGPLHRIESLLKKLLQKLEPGEGWKKHTKSIFWPFQKEEVVEHLGTIERCKVSILLVLGNDHKDISRQISADMGVLRAEVREGARLVREIHENQKRQDRRAKMDRETDILAWLSPLTFWAKQKDTYERLQPGTGRWFLEGDFFTKWRDGTLGKNKRILFCTGMPGAGKTILTSLAINHLENLIGSQNPTVDTLAYIYCDYRFQKQTATSLTAALLRNILIRLPELPTGVKTLYYRHKQLNIRPSLVELLKQLQAVTSVFKRTFIVIDALDECPEEERDTFINLLRKLGNGVSILVTSRQISSIEELFEDEVHQAIRAVDDDVKIYVKAQIQASRNLRSVIRDSKAAKKAPGGATGLLDGIINKITEKAQGMFLLAQLHVNTVSWRCTLKGVQDAIRELPDQLSSSYDNTMERIESYPDKERCRLAIHVLTWIMNAVGPLSVAELQHALAIQKDHSGLDEDALPSESIIVSLCAGLVTVDHESQQIRFVHQTTKEYFEQRSSKLLPNPHNLMATACLTYLSFENFDEFEAVQDMAQYVEEYPLLRYAATSWSNHVRELELHSDPDPEVNTLVVNFLKDTRKLAFATQVFEKCSDQLQLDTAVKLEEPQNLAPMSISTFLGLDSEKIQELPEEGSENNQDFNTQLYNESYAVPTTLSLEELLTKETLSSSGKPIFEPDFEPNRAELARLLLDNTHIE